MDPDVRLVNASSDSAHCALSGEKVGEWSVVREQHVNVRGFASFASFVSPSFVDQVETSSTGDQNAGISNSISGAPFGGRSIAMNKVDHKKLQTINK